jgi:molybdopterin-synthase adenylyltransferase
MLTDSQIERYSRQIVLSEVGGRGQEHLLAARATIVGSGEAAIFCAAHLAAAGVGWLYLDGVDTGAPLARAVALSTRNVDCTIGPVRAECSDVTILFGEIPPGIVVRDVPLVWGSGTAEGIVAARFPNGRGCLACLAELPRSRDTGGSSPRLLGALLALLALRALLKIDASDGPELLRFLRDGLLRVDVPFPSRPDCPVCA